MSASATVAGSISNALVHVTSPCEGSGASSTRPPPAWAVTRAVSMALRTRLAASVGADVDRGGEPDGAVDHDPDAHAELGVVRGALGCGVTQADPLGADALDPELGVRAAPGLAVERAASVSAASSSGGVASFGSSSPVSGRPG